MGDVEVFSPAKINLFLSVLGRRETGFHELLSVVGQLDFGDTVRISAQRSPEAGVSLRCSDGTLPIDRRNLAYAAAEGFLLRTGLKWQVGIELEKRIPHGAGLGGGSSNASAVLKGLCELAERAGELGLSRGERLELAAELGSDCPLFLEAGPTVLRGRGELLSSPSSDAARSVAGRQVVLFKPGFAINTGWAYSQLVERGDCYDDRGQAEQRLAAWEAGELTAEGLLHNSFEKAVFAKYLAFEPLFRKLREKGLAPLMSGSGSCCFSFVESDEEAAWVGRIARQCWGRRTFAQPARFLV